MNQTLRIVFFQNWSLLGCVLAEGLLDTARDELLLVGSHVPSTLRDRQLIDGARRHKVPLLAPKDLVEARFVKRLRDFNPDLLIVATFPKKIPNLLLELPRLAAVNLHPAYLPAYRGACPEFWVLRNGEPETGVSFHKMVERFDAGVILSQARIPILPDDTMLSLTERMLQPSWQLLTELLDAYRRGENPQGTPQDPKLVSRAPFVKPEHLQIDWREPASSIERLLRAAHPAYEVRTTFRNADLIVQRGVAVPAMASASLAPGELLPLPDQQRLLVGTGEGLLELAEAHITYGPTLSGWSLCLEYRIQAGDRLGQTPSPG